MANATYLIASCSRGLGLALAAQLSTIPSNEIFATARGDPTPALHRSSAETAKERIAASLDGYGIDVLINNAGIMNFTIDGLHTMDDLDSTFSTNVTGVHIVTSTFLPLLRQGKQKKVVNITSTVGSIAMAPGFMVLPAFAYKVSKAALNMLTVQYAYTYEKEGFAYLAVSPGSLKTDLGGQGSDLDVETGAKATLELIGNNGKESNGKLLNIHVAGWETNDGLNQYDSKVCPW